MEKHPGMVGKRKARPGRRGSEMRVIRTEPPLIEIWKDISGFEGIYQISNHGRLKSFKELPQGRILSNINNKGGYLSVVLCSRDRKRYCRMHVLVAAGFIDNPQNKPEVNHKDGNKQNNFFWNLEWTTRVENHHHMMKSKKTQCISGMNRYNTDIRPKKIMQLSMNGEIISEFKNSKEAGRATGICHRNILQVAAETEYKPGLKRRQAGGFIWRFKDGIQTNSEFKQGELLSPDL